MNIFDVDMDNSDSWMMVSRVSWIGLIAAFFLSGVAHWVVWGIAVIWWLTCVAISYMTYPHNGR